MSWEYFTARDGTYLVDWQGVTQIIRSFNVSKSVWHNSRIDRDKGFWAGLGPDLYTVKIDWKKVHEAKVYGTEDYLQIFHQMALTQSMPAAVAWLEERIAKTRKFKGDYVQRLHIASRKTANNINRAVELGELGVMGAKLFRDSATDFLIIGSSFVPGGYAVTAGVLGWGATLKAFAKYQDTGNSGASIAQFGMTMGFGMLKLKLGDKIIGAGNKIALNIVIAKVEAGTQGLSSALIEGKTLREAFLTGAIKMGLSSWRGLINAELKDGFKAFAEFSGNKWIETLAIPAQMAIKYATDDITKSITDRIVRKNTAPSLSRPPIVPPLQAGQFEQSLIDAASLDKQYIERCVVKKIMSGY